MTSGCVTLAASRLLGPDAAPAPRLAMDKSTARPSAKRRRIQLPLIVESLFRSYAPLVRRSSNATGASGACQPDRRSTVTFLGLLWAVTLKVLKRVYHYPLPPSPPISAKVFSNKDLLSKYSGIRT